MLIINNQNNNCVIHPSETLINSCFGIKEKSNVPLIYDFLSDFQCVSRT